MSEPSEKQSTRERILSVSVRLFMEQGYKKTTVSDITQLAHVSNSSFQHFFRAKDGVLTELVHFMYSNQFDMARLTAAATLPPVYVYAVETAIQIALTELNENLREIYIEAYTHEETLAFIHQQTARELHSIFGAYQPELTLEDFYVLELGTCGMMRGFMAEPCTDSFPLEKKLHSFILSALRVYHVPEDEIQQVLSFIRSLNILDISRTVMEKLFTSLAMHFDFTISGA